MNEYKTLTNEQLVEVWNKGAKWLTEHEQVSGTKKARNGKPYDHDVWLEGLNRIEAIEDEMIKRGIERKR